jgi:NAD(P)-dependent dehydrogenase (short-subunit alcohol dehydrogenase family)
MLRLLHHAASLEIFERVMRVNSTGVFLCYKYAAKKMISQGRGGRIIGASSIAGQQGQYAGHAYTASKFAVRALTQSVGESLLAYAITMPIPRGFQLSR